MYVFLNSFNPHFEVSATKATSHRQNQNEKLISRVPDSQTNKRPLTRITFCMSLLPVGQMTDYVEHKQRSQIQSISFCYQRITNQFCRVLPCASLIEIFSHKFARSPKMYEETGNNKWMCVCKQEERWTTCQRSVKSVAILTQRFQRLIERQLTCSDNVNFIRHDNSFIVLFSI